jgi:peptide-O-fucosyltransferase
LNACKNAEGLHAFMASPQCLDEHTTYTDNGSRRQLTREMCLPSKKTILNDLEDVLVNKLNGTISNVYIATDKDPMLSDIRAHFENNKKLGVELNLVHRDPWLPLIDLAILARSEHFIGNCVSSFTSFVKRERDINNKSSSFWAFY